MEWGWVGWSGGEGGVGARVKRGWEWSRGKEGVG